MKSMLKSKFLILTAAACLALGAATAHAGTVPVTFGFQKGNLTTNGVAFGSGGSYSGVLDGSISDGSIAGALTTGLTSTIGNQFRSPNGQNGQQHVGLFSYDLTELETFIAANTGPNSSVSIASVSMTVIAATAASGSPQTLSLFGTDPFTSSGCTWSNYTTATPWTVPFQNIASNMFQFGYTGGGSSNTPSLGGSSPNTGVGAGNPLTWTSSTNFINAVTNALAQADKKLNLTARVNFLSNGDSRVSVIYSPTNTALRPQLQIIVNVTTTAASATWTGGTDTSWTTAGNWLAGIVPATDAPIIFDNNSAANLNTVLNQDFTTASISVTNPSGAVSIAGPSILTNGTGGIDLSAATQNLTISAPVVLGASQTWNIGSGRTLGLNGGVSGSALLTIAGAGKVSLGAANVLPNGASSSNLVVNGTLDLNGTSQAMNGLSGNGSVDNTGGGTSILTFGNNNAGGSFSGTIQNTSGTLALVKDGSGSQTMTGTSTFSGGFTNNGSGSIFSGNAAGTNLCLGIGPVVANAGTIYMANASYTFTNALTLNGGALRQGGGNSRLLTWTGPVGVTASSTLQSDGGTAGLAIYGDVALSPGATLGSTAGGTAHIIYGAIGGSGSLTVSSGLLTLNGSNAFTGGLTMNGGTVNSAGTEGTNYCFGTGPVVANGGTIYMVVTNYIITNALTLNGGALRQGGANNRLLTWSGPVNVTSNSTLLSDGGTAGLAIYGNVTLANSATLSSSASGTAHTLYGSIGGTGNLTNNSGTLSLEAACNYNGTTVISAGTLRADLNGTIPSGSALTINGSGIFNVRNTNAWVYNGTITGDGTGSINLNTGTTAQLAGNISGVAGINAGTAGTDATISGNISGANSVTVQDTGGILRLTGVNAYSGVTTVNTNGILFVNGDNSGATGNVQVNEGGTLAGAGTNGGAAAVIGNVSPGSAGSAGVGSVGTLTLASSLDVSGLASGTGKLNYDLGATNASDKIVVSGALTIGSGVLGFSDFVFTNVGGLQNGTYKLITSGAAITDTLDGADLSGSVGAGTGTIQTNASGTDIELVVIGIGGPVTPSPTLLTNVFTSTSLTLSWPANQGWRLQEQTNALSKGLSTNWVFVTDNSVSSTNIPVDKTKPATFYRLVSP